LLHQPRNDKEEVTLKDIAEAVGKSVAAVSRALNDYDDISPETRTYIKQVAFEMGYTPNLMAQRLKKRTTDTLGFILPVLSPKNSDPYFSELLVGIANEATAQGFDLLVSTCVPGYEEVQAYLRLINSHRIDGIIVARSRRRDPRLDLLLEKQFPFVVIGTVDLQKGFLLVSDDAATGARLVVNHLVARGHRKIGLVNTPMDLTFSAEFFDGMKGAMLEANLEIDQNYWAECDFSQKGGYQAAQTLLSGSETPTAIVTADDVVALGVMAAVHDQGFQVGHDIAITGYGDILLAEHAQPPLTTVQRSTYNLGQQACRMLVTKLRGELLEQEHLVFKPSLVIRQSSDLDFWL